MTIIKDIIADIHNQLEWRGPTGQPQTNVVIPRADADVMLTYLKMLSKLMDILKEG